VFFDSVGRSPCPRQTRPVPTGTLARQARRDSYMKSQIELLEFSRLDGTARSIKCVVGM